MKIYVGNLPFDVDDDKLRELFSSFGEVEEATVIKNKFSGRSKGFGFVTFKENESASKAISEMNEKEIEGRKIRVSEAKPMEERPMRPERRGSFNRNRGFNRNRNFKENREEF